MGKNEISIKLAKPENGKMTLFNKFKYGINNYKLRFLGLLIYIKNVTIFHNLQFSTNHVPKIKEVSENKSKELESLDAKYAALFREHPFQVPPDFLIILEKIL